MSYAKIIMYIYRPPKKEKETKISSPFFFKEKEEMKKERNSCTYLFILVIFISFQTHHKEEATI